MATSGSTSMVVTESAAETIQVPESAEPWNVPDLGALALYCPSHCSYLQHILLWSSINHAHDLGQLKSEIERLHFTVEEVNASNTAYRQSLEAECAAHVISKQNLAVEREYRTEMQAEIARLHGDLMATQAAYFSVKDELERVKVSRRVIDLDRTTDGPHPGAHATSSLVWVERYQVILQCMEERIKALEEANR